MAITDSLRGYWKLNEGAGVPILTDLSGNSETLTNNGTTPSGAGQGYFDRAADLEAGSSQYFSRADSAGLSMGATDFSVTAWVNLESKPANFMGIVSKDDASTQREFQIGWRNDTDRFYAFVANNLGGATTILRSATTFGAPSLATWYFLCAKWDSVAHTLSISVNNGAFDSTTNAGVTVADGTQAFEIGRTNASLHFDGLIAQVAVWKRVLTASEVTALYNSGNGLADIRDLLVPLGGRALGRLVA